MRDSHWSATVNEKTHSFWSHGRLTDRLKLTLGDVGISVTEVSEAGSTSECPECNSNHVQRDGDEFRCTECGLEAHSDIVGVWNLLQKEVGSMARPAALRVERRRDASQPNSGQVRERTGSGTSMTGYSLILRNCQTRVTNPASANSYVRSRGNRLGGLPTEESHPFRGGRNSNQLVHEVIA